MHRLSLLLSLLTVTDDVSQQLGSGGILDLLGEKEEEEEDEDDDEFFSLSQSSTSTSRSNYSAWSNT
jgi:hypothetical protein